MMAGKEANRRAAVVVQSAVYKRILVERAEARQRMLEEWAEWMEKRHDP